MIEKGYDICDGDVTKEYEWTCQVHPTGDPASKAPCPDASNALYGKKFTNNTSLPTIAKNTI